jgi:hypothetical protein
MKFINIILVLCISAMVLTSCYKEVDPNDDNFTVVGNIAIVSQLLVPANRAKARDMMELTIRCNAKDIQIKEFKFFQRFGTSGAFVESHTAPFVSNFVQEERLHVVKVMYPVPNEPGKTFQIQVDAITENGLASRRRGMTIMGGGSVITITE